MNSTVKVAVVLFAALLTLGTAGAVSAAEPYILVNVSTGMIDYDHPYYTGNVYLMNANGLYLKNYQMYLSTNSTNINLTALNPGEAVGDVPAYGPNENLPLPFFSANGCTFSGSNTVPVGSLSGYKVTTNALLLVKFNISNASLADDGSIINITTDPERDFHHLVTLYDVVSGVTVLKTLDAANVMGKILSKSEPNSIAVVKEHYTVKEGKLPVLDTKLETEDYGFFDNRTHLNFTVFSEVIAPIVGTKYNVTFNSSDDSRLVFVVDNATQKSIVLQGEQFAVINGTLLNQTTMSVLDVAPLKVNFKVNTTLNIVPNVFNYTNVTLQKDGSNKIPDVLDLIRINKHNDVTGTGIVRTVGSVSGYDRRLPLQLLSLHVYNASNPGVEIFNANETGSYYFTINITGNMHYQGWDYVKNNTINLTTGVNETKFFGFNISSAGMEGVIKVKYFNATTPLKATLNYTSEAPNWRDDYYLNSTLTEKLVPHNYRVIAMSNLSYNETATQAGFALINVNNFLLNQNYSVKYDNGTAGAGPVIVHPVSLGFIGEPDTHQAAQNKSSEFVFEGYKLGDVNLDKSVNIDDVTDILIKDGTPNAFTQAEAFYGSVHGTKNDPCVKDAAEILRYLNHLTDADYTATFPTVN